MKIKFENPPLFARWIMFRRSLNIMVFFRRIIEIDFSERHNGLLRRINQEELAKVHKTIENKGENK
jgi:hypothetical protein